MSDHVALTVRFWSKWPLSSRFTACYVPVAIADLGCRSPFYSKCQGRSLCRNSNSSDHLP